MVTPSGQGAEAPRQVSMFEGADEVQYPKPTMEEVGKSEHVVLPKHRETKAEKAERLILSARLTVTTVGDPERPGLIVASCRGDDGAVYDLGYDPTRAEYRCTCQAAGRFHVECSHLIALKLVTVRPT